MKKSLIISALAFACTALPAYASTLDLSPQTVTVAPGQTVSVVVSVAPAGATLSAIKSDISYPTGLLTPTSFTFAPTWIPLTQSGYDQMTGGMIIKSAGYPGGLTDTAVLGTIVFTAQAAGTATVAVQSSSIAYDTAGNNALTGAQGAAAVTIRSVTVTPLSASSSPSTASATSSATTTTAPSSMTRTAPKGGAAATLAPIARATDIASSSGAAPALTGTAQTAAAADAGAAGIFGSVWPWLLLVLILAAGGLWLYGRRKRD
ncbi:MAG TPA: cohesin domain-containing protein [Candidatus Paceibacterota bacterium]|nr:cohesin domain-containing protein [Candidatus Paceibacterota bacterium]